MSMVGHVPKADTSPLVWRTQERWSGRVTSNAQTSYAPTYRIQGRCKLVVDGRWTVARVRRDVYSSDDV